MKFFRASTNPYRFESMSTLASELDVDLGLIAPIPELPRIQEELDQIKSRREQGLGLVTETARNFIGQHEDQLPHRLRGRVHYAASTPAEFLKMPKAELHLHRGVMADIFTTAKLAWHLSAQTDGQLQAKYGTIQNLIHTYLDVKKGSLEAYLENYNELAQYINRDLEAIRFIVFSGAMRAFENGVNVLELRTSLKSGVFGDPKYRSQMKDANFGPKEEVRAIIEGLKMAERATGGQLKCYIGVLFRRSSDEGFVERALNETIRISDELAIEFGERILNHVDIGGAETQKNDSGKIISKAKKFAPLFRKARDHGLHVTAHAGEGNGSGEGSIWHALSSGAQRIGHGTALYRPWNLLSAEQYVSGGFKKNAFILSLMLGVPYEMCLSSNLACAAEVTLGYKPTIAGKPEPIRGKLERLEQYPAVWMMALGGLQYTGRSPILPIPCTDGIHTLNTNQAREYGLAAETFDMGIAELLGLSRYSIRYSFATPEVKAQALKQWRSYASVYLNDPAYSSPDEQAKAALEAYCLQARSRLGITPEIAEEIRREVHTPDGYMPEEILHFFRAYQRYPVQEREPIKLGSDQ